MIFQQCNVRDDVNVVDTLREDFENYGNVCIDKDGYCGTDNGQGLILGISFKSVADIMTNQHYECFC